MTCKQPRPHRSAPLSGAALLAASLVAAAPIPAGEVAEYGGCAGTVVERVVEGDPGNYLALLPTLRPGDLFRLSPGTYADGFQFHDMSGEKNRCIVVEGPEAGPAAILTGRDCCNTISLQNSSYLVIRNLELNGLGRLGDGVKAESPGDWAHHITLENLYIRGHGADQQIVGINTKCPAWNWVIRNNVIEAAGTGLYLGAPDAEDEFSNGLIEYNLIIDTLGYNMQIKHQSGRATALGAPASGTTLIRHNVLSKASNGNGGGNARPNLLVGHWPLTGAGSDDDYLIYGNFFYQNPTEALFQGEGNVVFYDNVLVNDFGPAVHIQPHNDLPKRIRIFQNTLVATGRGIRVIGGDPGFAQRVVGNAVFAGTPISGGVQIDNVTDAYGEAATYVSNPDGGISGAADRLDLYPLPGLLGGPAIDLSGLGLYPDWDRDFNGDSRSGGFRGAYAGEGTNPGWGLALERKPEAVEALFTDGFESGDLSNWSG